MSELTRRARIKASPELVKILHVTNPQQNVQAPVWIRTPTEFCCLQSTSFRQLHVKQFFHKQEVFLFRQSHWTT